MCGIAGLVGRLDAQNRAAVEAMSCALEHRGPDADAVWTSSPDADGWGCLLAHRRLSVLDLSSTADQPMHHPESGQALVYNGELYNFPTLRAELVAAGERLASTGDTEVLLRLLTREGIAALPRLRGMFAFASWDPRNRTLLLARDPLGIKPLYVAVNPDPDGSWSLLFASELRAILRTGLVPPRLDPDAVASVVWNGFVTGPGTALRGVQQVPPGTVTRYEGRGRAAGSTKYWRSAGPVEGPPLSVPELADELRTCVAQHLVSDVPLAVFLSSGVDSSAVANLAASAVGDGVRTFTLSFDVAEHSEGEDARAIAAAIGTDHTEILLRAEHFRGGLETAIETLDQPTFDGLNSLYMSRAVRAAGIKVALVGTGGDELFGGYESFRQLPRVARLLSSPALPGPVRLAVAAAMQGARPGRGPVPAQTRWAKLPDFLAAGGDLLSLYQLSYALFLPEFQRRLLLDGIEPLADGLSPTLAAELRAEVKGMSPLPALSRLEQQCFLGERLLRDNDAVAMSVSLEMRLPLVDSVLTETVERLAVAERYEPVGRKALLRTVGLAGLDPLLFDRPKRGFVLPYDRWLRGELRDEVAQVLLDGAACRRVGLDPGTVTAVWHAFQSGAPGLYWSRVWALYVLIAWADHHGVAL